MFKKLFITVISGLLLQMSSVANAQVTESKGKMTAEEISKALSDFGGEAVVQLSDVMKAVLERSGQPTALILGDEMQGSFFVGYRKGNGKIVFHQQALSTSSDLRWSAPSIGINVGATKSKVAILVYGAENIEQLKQRFVSIQGSYHLIGGAGVSYMTNQNDHQADKINLVYISVGVGLDAGFAIESLSFK